MSRRTGARRPRRVLTLVGALAIALGAVTAGVPTTALASATEDPPAAGDPTPQPSEPTPTDPTPAPSPSPTPEPTSEPSPSPSPTPSDPTPPGAPETGPSTPAASAPATPAAATAPVVPEAPAGPTLPTLLGKVYPTNPWIYTGRPGTRFLDERQRDAGGQIVRRHLGIDAQGGPRQPIFAVADGTVVAGTWQTSRRDRHGFGNYVQLAHDGGYTTLYAHLDGAPLVETGAHVTAGQVIGYMGASQRGNPTAVARHLHFEVALNGHQIDPLLFLDGAASTTGSAPADAAGVSPVSAAAETYALTEMRADDRGAYVATPTGIDLSTTVFAAVDTGGASADVFASEGGTLRRLAALGGVWSEIDTGLPLTATSISGASRSDGGVDLFAVEDGRLFHLAGDASGWTKTWTGHEFSGDVHAVRLPGGELHAMLAQSGYLYHLSPAAGGLWNVADTRLRVGDEFDAVYVTGAAPDVMTIIDGEITRIVASGPGWTAVPTGLTASGRIAAVSDGSAWPAALSADGDGLARTRVADGWWRQWVDPIAVTGAIDAVSGLDTTPVVYAVG